MSNSGDFTDDLSNIAPISDRKRWNGSRPRNSLLETNLVLPRRGAVKKLFRRLWMSKAERTADIASAPDRIVMNEQIFPEAARLAGNILFVGVRAYTMSYPKILEQQGGICWTLDRDADAAEFGVPGRHVTGCITDVGALLPSTLFTTIILTGVLGFGVNRFSDQRRALAACADRLADGGTLILGWNDRRVHSSLLEEATSNWFDFRPFGDLPPRVWVVGHDHNFAFLSRRTRGPLICD